MHLGLKVIAKALDYDTFEKKNLLIQLNYIPKDILKKLAKCRVCNYFT